MLVHSRPHEWTVSYDAGTNLKGDPIKTDLQGVSDDPDLLIILEAMEEIKKSPYDSYSSLPFLGGQINRHRVGEKLLDFLVRVVRSGDKKKLVLLEKCMKYLESTTKTKLYRFTNSLLGFCDDFGRLPTPTQLHSRIVANGHNFSSSAFYNDLNEIGLGWLSRDRKKRK
jgi:hypothetical protein